MLAFPDTLGWQLSQPPCTGKADPRMGYYQLGSCKEMLKSHFKKSSWCFPCFCVKSREEKSSSKIPTFFGVFILQRFFRKMNSVFHPVCCNISIFPSSQLTFCLPSLVHSSIRGTKFILVPHKIGLISTIKKLISGSCNKQRYWRPREVKWEW